MIKKLLLTILMAVSGLQASAATVNMLAVYDTYALAWYESDAAVQQAIQTEVASLNNIMAASGLGNNNVVIVGSMMHTTVESLPITSISPLAFLQNPQILAARDAANADVIIVFEYSTAQINPNGLCGESASIQPPAAYALAVVNMACFDIWTLEHEFMHLAGARHDATNDPTAYPYLLAHGYVDLTTVGGINWCFGTIMQANIYGCPQPNGNNQSGPYPNSVLTIPWFSDPYKTYNVYSVSSGETWAYVPIGNSGAPFYADLADSMTSGLTVLSGYRNTKISGSNPASTSPLARARSKMLTLLYLDIIGNVQQ